MRYEIGQIVPVINFKAKYDNGNIFDDCVRPMPWTDEVLEINIRQIVCISHHKVHDCNDDKERKDCDGFLFAADGVTEVHNQYPCARYGQLNDSQDRMFDFVMKSDDGTIIDVSQFTDLSYYLADVLCGIHQLKSMQTKMGVHKEHPAKSFGVRNVLSAAKLAERITSLTTLYDKVVQKFEELTEKKVVVSPVVLNEEVLEEFFDVSFE